MKWLPSSSHRQQLGLLLALTLLSIPASAQGPDSRGKDFWVAFMSNLGSLDETSQMRLYLSCSRPTVARITYTATGVTQTIAIPVPNTTVAVAIDTLFGPDVELADVNPAVVVDRGEIVPKGIHVESDDPITLYGVNIRSKSADAFLGLPTNVLTGRYIVLAYPNGYVINAVSPGRMGSFDTPSEFCVVATEENTTVTIVPARGLSINGRGNAEFTVTLGRGQVFFGQADVIASKELDVSGTQIRANKPVAVFGGNKRTSIPTRVGNYRDHLVEQLPPLEAWGKGALLTPHFKVTPQSTDTAVVRILAAFPGTSVTVNRAGRSDSYILSPGAPIELPLLEPMSVGASAPILAAQYEHSVNVSANSGFEIGDPFMMLAVPAEQFDTAYSFQSVVNPEFTVHYVNLVAPQGGTGGVTLDGAPVSAAFLPIPGSRYMYAQMEVGEGSHYIRGDSAFGLYVYGFGRATSYGYPGGMLFRRLVFDLDVPEMTGALGCGEYRGVATDSHINDTGIDSCLVASDTSNVRVAIDPFTRGEDSVGFSASLVDPYRDGVFTIKAIDTAGRSRTQHVEIPGFTVSAGASVPAALDTFLLLDSRGCRRVTLHNYGGHEQKVTSAVAADPLARAAVSTPMPIVIAPGDSAFLDICFSALPDTVFDVTLTIGGECAARAVASFPVLNIVDTAAPSIGRDGIPCGDDFILTYYKRFRTSGIASFHGDTAINCTVDPLPPGSDLPPNAYRVHLHRLDPRRDLIYQVTLRDSSGNAFIDRDTIGGFTLAMLGETRDSIGVRFDRSWIGDTLPMSARLCDSLLIVNYGGRGLSVAGVHMKGNVAFSVPQSLFPLLIPARDSVRVAVCIEGLQAGDMIDTLVLLDQCGHDEELAMMTPVKLFALEGADRCNNAISINTLAPAKRLFLSTPVPNPAEAVAYVDLGLDRDETVDFELFDAAGRPALPVLRRIALPSGINRVLFDVSALDGGAYFCRLTTVTGRVRVEKMVVGR
jgi:hypothetical protein